MQYPFRFVRLTLMHLSIPTLEDFSKELAVMSVMSANDPKHTSKFIERYFAEKNINWWKTPVDFPNPKLYLHKVMPKVVDSVLLSLLQILVCYYAWQRKLCSLLHEPLQKLFDFLYFKF